MLDIVVFLSLLQFREKKQAKKALVFRVFQAPEGKLEVNEERETSTFFPVARVSRSTPALCFVRLKSAKNRRSTG